VHNLVKLLTIDKLLDKISTNWSFNIKSNSWRDQFYCL